MKSKVVFPSPSSAAAPSTPVRPRRRWKWPLAILLGGIVTAIGLAPWIVVQWMLPTALHNGGHLIRGSLAYGNARFGWTTPLTLTSVLATDEQGETLAEAAEIRTELSLLRLLRSRTSLGTLTIEQPKLRIVAGAGPTNLETFLEPLLSGPPSKDPLSVAWQVRDGTIEIVDADSSETVSRWNVARVDGSFQRDVETQLNIDVAAEVRTANGTGQFELTLKTDEDAQQHRAGTLSGTLRDVPLDLLRPLWPRLHVPVSLNGVCNAQFQGNLLRGNQGEVTWRDLSATGVTFQSPELLKGDTIAFAQLASAGQLRWDRGQWHASLDATSDYGTTRLRADSMTAGRAPTSMRLLGASDLELDADLDVARLIRALPRTLRMRDGVSVESGRAKVHIDSHAEAASTRWNATLTTSDLVADHDGKRVVWKNPIDARLAARWNNEHWQVDELRCQSEFLNANLEGTADEATVRLEADLEKLAERLKDFLALPAELRGHIDGHLHWQRHPPDIVADATLNVKNFACNVPTRRAWQEPAMVLVVQATARPAANGAWSELRELRGELTAEPDRLVASLKQPMSLTSWGQGVALDVHWLGELSTWQRRLGPLLKLGDLAAAGTIDLKGQALVTERAVRLDELAGEIRELSIHGAEVRIQEPRITVNLQGELDLARQRLASKHAEVVSSVVAFRADDVQFSWAAPASTSAETPPASSGSIEFRSDLSRLRGWFPQVSAATPSWATSGEIVGRATLAQPMQLEGEIRQFQLFDETRPTGQTVSTAAERRLLWEEPLVSFLARGDWDPVGEARLEQLVIGTSGLRLNAAGKLSHLRETPLLELDGSLDYDWKAYHQRLLPLLGSSFSVAGRRSDPFRLTGRLTSDHSALVPPSLAGTALVGWDSVSYHGIDIGPGTTNAALQDALLKISAVDVPVSGGRFRAEPHIDLRGDTPLLTLPPGVVLDQVQISPEMCRSWLKYIAPLVANATRAQGTFSMQLDRLKVPLGRPEQADVAGALVVQQAAVGPGPLAQTVISLVDRVTAIAERRVPRLATLSGDTWLQMPAQVVAYEIQNGRVVHRELRMQVKDLTVISRGWVAVDQSMELSIEIPVPDKWIDNNRLLEGLRGKTIAIPVRGTLAKPEVDERLLTELSKGLLGNAAEKLLEDQLRRGLDRLFRP